MPLTEKGQEILKAMKKQYGEKKGEEVFYASANKGTITGVHGDQAMVGQLEQPSPYVKPPLTSPSAYPQTPVLPGIEHESALPQAVSIEELKGVASRYGVK